MKKILCLLGLIFLVTGCTNLNDMPMDEMVDSVLQNSNKKATEALVGYKIYIPTGMTLISDNNNNIILYSNGYKYYLYADVISYYKKTENDYKMSDVKDAVYQRELDNDSKKGYILVTRKGDKFFVEIMYNYAKIEVLTYDIKDCIVKSLVLLNSLSYNDYVVESLVGSNVLNYNEEDFKLEGPESNNNSGILTYDEGNNEDYFKDDLPNDDSIDIDIDIDGQINQ